MQDLFCVPSEVLSDVGFILLCDISECALYITPLYNLELCIVLIDLSHILFILALFCGIPEIMILLIRKVRREPLWSN